MELYLRNIYSGINQKIDTVYTEKEVFEKISSFLNKHNYKSYYTRIWINPDNILEKVYDFGSHTLFFICYNEKGWDK